MHVIQVEPHGLTVHLEKATSVMHRLEQAIEIERKRRALAEQSAARMSQDRSLEISPQDLPLHRLRYVVPRIVSARPAGHDSRGRAIRPEAKRESIERVPSLER
jgi:hypothetical protein